MNDRSRLRAAAAALLVSVLLSGCAKAGNAVADTVSDSETNPVQTVADSNVDTDDDTTAPLPETSAEQQTEPVPDGPGEPLPKDRKYNILMIGNSYSYVNDMILPNGIFASVARAAGYDVKITCVYKGGYYLRQFLDANDTYGKRVRKLLESDTKYDFVVIQEQSANAIAVPKDFFRSVRKFKELADSNGAELCLYATWGYKTGHSKLANYGPTTFDMEMKQRAAYNAIGEELGVRVANVGAGFTMALKEYPELNTYSTDLTHPSLTGSYLAAYTIFATIFNCDPADVDYNGTLPAKTAEKVREIASGIFRNGVTVDEEFKVSSSGKG